MKKQLLILLLVLVCKLSAFSQSNYATITGLVTGPDSSPIADVNVLLSPLGRGAVTDARGRFSLERIPAGQYTLVASHLGFQSQRLELTLKEGEALTRRIVLAPTSQRLRDVEVIGGRAFPHTSFLPQVEGTNIYAGKKNEAVNLQGLDADLAAYVEINEQLLDAIVATTDANDLIARTDAIDLDDNLVTIIEAPANADGAALAQRLGAKLVLVSDDAGLEVDGATVIANHQRYAGPNAIAEDRLLAAPTAASVSGCWIWRWPHAVTLAWAWSRCGPRRAGRDEIQPPHRRRTG